MGENKSMIVFAIFMALLSVSVQLGIAQDKILGPWLWMCVKVDGQGGANATDQDTLKLRSDGQVTEDKVAKNGVKVGDKVGELVWSPAKIAAVGGNNVNPVANILDFCDGDCDDITSYAFIGIEATDAGNRTMRVGSDDSIKVWFNGKVVHKNAVDRGAVNFQDNFKVAVKKGKNLLLVKVSERSGGWSMFVGMEGEFTAAGKKYPGGGGGDPEDGDGGPVRDGVAGNKVTGPWLWMMAASKQGQGGAASTDFDSLDEASKGKVTEKKIAKEGAKAGQRVGKLKWTLGEISPVGSNNVNDLIIKLKLGKGDIDHHSSYAYVNVVSPGNRQGVGFAGSDDSIKIWLNGKVVHRKAVDRGAGNFQDKFSVSLRKGDNPFLVKVSERTGGWSMFVGFDTRMEKGLRFNIRKAKMAVDSTDKLVTVWGRLKRSS
ncbi:TPA: hypothetical protein EYN98_01680 [Candidatus Poribacteria bacterium]|nr:hypothetical protein [Candidatus Poribacteria bacterium]